jgi:hypothetical protein
MQFQKEKEDFIELMKQQWGEAEKEMKNRLKVKHSTQKALQQPETIPEEEKKVVSGEAARRLEQ